MGRRASRLSRIIAVLRERCDWSALHPGSGPRQSALRGRPTRPPAARRRRFPRRRGREEAGEGRLGLRRAAAARRPGFVRRFEGVGLHPGGHLEAVRHARRTLRELQIELAILRWKKHRSNKKLRKELVKIREDEEGIQVAVNDEEGDVEKDTWGVEAKIEEIKEKLGLARAEQVRTVVELDLVAYSDIARSLELRLNTLATSATGLPDSGVHQRLAQGGRRPARSIRS